MSKLLRYTRHIILDLNKYFKSEEFIFDIVILSFIAIFNYIVPHSRDKLLDFLQHSPRNEFFVSISIQIMIGFNVGRYGGKISNTKKKGCLNTAGFLLLFFLWIFSANFIEQSESRGVLYLVLTILVGFITISLSLTWGINYEKNFINSKNENKKRIEIFFRIFLVAFSYSVLMLYQALEMENWKAIATMDTNTESISWVLLVTIVTGLLPFRILLFLKPPVTFFGIFMGIAAIFIDLFS